MQEVMMVVWDFFLLNFFGLQIVTTGIFVGPFVLFLPYIEYLNRIKAYILTNKMDIRVHLIKTNFVL